MIAKLSPHWHARRLFDYVIRPLHFHLLAQIPTVKSKTEDKKTALYSSRRVAAVFVLLHLLPITTCIVLVILNLRTLFVGSITTAALTAIQFAAKLLEVLIQVSIAAVVLALIRHQVLSASPFPFGGLIAPYRITDLSLLWSIETWGLFTSFEIREWRKIAGSLMIPVAVILAAIVGPSSAVLMIQRPISYPVLGHLWLLDPVDVLYPVRIVLNNSLLALESEYNSTSHQYSVNSQKGVWPIADRFGLRNLWANGDGDDFSSPSISTTPSAVSEALLSIHVDFYYDTATAHTLQPYVYTDCWDVEIPMTSFLSNDSCISFGPAKRYLDNFMPYAWLMPNASYGSDDDSFAIIETVSDEDWSLTAVLSRTPLTVSNNSLLLAWALFDTWTDPWYNGDTVITGACTIDASWVAVATSKYEQAPSNEEGLGDIKDPSDLLFSSLKDKRNIHLSPSWTARVLKLGIPELMSDYQLESMASPLISLALSYVPQMPASRRYFGRGEVWPGDGFTHQQNQSLSKLIEDNYLLDKYEGVLLTGYDKNWTDATKLSQIVISRFRDGCGYDSSTLTVQLSLAVIMFYLLMVTAYLTYSVTIGLAASSWDSIAELVTLALNSERPGSLRNTSVGINTLETFRQPVNIRVNANDSLELVFDSQSNKGHYRLVEVNRQY